MESRVNRFSAPFVYREEVEEKKDCEEIELQLSSAPITLSEKKEIKETAAAVHEYFTEKNLLEGGLAQGRVADTIVAPPLESLTLSRLKGRIEHENGIMGSYCLSDLRSIQKLVSVCYKKLIKYDCFNYETVKTIKETVALKKLFEENKEFLDRQQEQKELQYVLYYQDKQNDLLEHGKESTWERCNRYFVKTMIFFNPYNVDKKGTLKLINAFFSYAESNLHKDGIAIMMWDPQRKDDLGGISIILTAKYHKFDFLCELSGQKFASLTGFVHTKNSRSLDKSNKSKDGTAKVKSKITDVIYLFKKQNQKPELKENYIASAMIERLSEKK